MLSIEHITKSFGDKILFEDYNLSIKDGEFVVLKGVSGSGKTTLLHMIGGLETPDSGTITYNGENIHNKKILLRYLKNDVGFLFQNFALVERKTVLDNLLIINRKARTEYTPHEVLKFVGLEDKMNTEVYKLSGGEQQRVALARLMLKRCSIILADEPTGSLDADNAKNVIAILQEFNRQGKTIIMVTHSSIIEDENVQVRIEYI